MEIAYLKSKQVAPLPIGPGGKSTIKQQMNDTNTQLAMMASQATANTMYDPPVPKPVTKQVIAEGFCSEQSLEWMIALGVILILYGILAK